MGDTIRNDAAHEWRQLCQAVFFGLDPIKLLERTVDARNAVLDGIEDTVVGATGSAWWQIAAVSVSPPAHTHRRSPPSALSCVRQFPRSSSLPPGVEAAERTRKGYTPSRATTRTTT
jgi:hypothetical protein